MDFPKQHMQKVLKKYGSTPIPPYMKHSPLSEAQRRLEYQSVFAKDTGSVAAPTASLHFTKALLKKIKRQGIEVCYVTLHVNLGTFASLTEENFKTGKLHEEFYKIDKKTVKILQKAKKSGLPIIACGTTVVRALESAFQLKGYIQAQGRTELFLHPPHTIKSISGLITNFHVPKSSLMMLVSCLVGRKKLLDLYNIAVRKKFRLFSFGDAMLIL